MLAKDAIKAVMEKKGETNASLGKLIGKPTKTIIDRLSQKNISADKMNEMLGALGYKIVIMPVEQEVGENCYTIE